MTGVVRALITTPASSDFLDRQHDNDVVFVDHQLQQRLPFRIEKGRQVFGSRDRAEPAPRAKFREPGEQFLL